VDSARRAVMETAELEWGAAASEFAYEGENHRPICQRVTCQRYLALSLLVDGQGLQVDADRFRLADDWSVSWNVSAPITA
jgi:hypothetical protein